MQHEKIELKERENIHIGKILSIYLSSSMYIWLYLNIYDRKVSTLKKIDIKNDKTSRNKTVVDNIQSLKRYCDNSGISSILDSVIDTISSLYSV